MADGQLLFFRPATGSGELVFGDVPDTAVVSVKTLSGFVAATISLFNGTAWVSASTKVTG